MYPQIRLTIADWFKIDQNDMKKRLALSVPLLAAGYLISFLDYSTVWRYFFWSNQTLAMMTLWAGSTYLCKFVGRKYSWIAVIPATYKKGDDESPDAIRHPFSLKTGAIGSS